MANKQGFEEVVAFVKKLGYYETGFVKGDMDIDWEYTFSQDGAPTSFGFGVSDMRFDTYLPGDFGNIERVDIYRQSNMWPSNFAMYLKEEGKPIVPCTVDQMFLWLAQFLIPEVLQEKYIESCIQGEPNNLYLSHYQKAKKYRKASEELRLAL